MAGELGSLVVSLSADMAKFQSDMGKAVKVTQDSSKAMAASLEMVNGAIAKMGSALVGVVTIAGFAKLIDSAAEWNIQAQKMANTFGITTEASSVFEVAVAKLGISHDTAMNAALKLSRTLSQGTDKFDKYGVSVLDANGKLLPMPVIMSNVNEKLLQTKSGADRNTMAMTLYGRSWGELQEILRLTPEAMQAAQATAERLHLIVGPEGAAMAYQYKESIHEIELVGKSLAVQFGNELLPAIISVASNLGGKGVSAATMFGGALKELTRDIQEAVIYWTAGMDKINVFLKNGGPLGLIFNRKSMMGQMANIQQAEYDSLKAISDAYGKQPAKSKTPTGETITPGTKGAGKELAGNSAYLAYLKSYYETIAQLQKQANNAEEQLNQIAYDWGLESLGNYLKKKHDLNENSLQIELNAKQKELTAAQEMEKKALAVYAKNRTPEIGAKVNKAYDDTQKAIMAVNAAQAAMEKARVANADEYLHAVVKEGDALAELQAKVLDLAGEYEHAALMRRAFYRASKEYLDLTPEQKKEQDKLDNSNVFRAGARTKDESNQRLFGNRAIQNKIPDMWGRTAGPLGADLKLEYDQQTAAVQAQLDAINAMDFQSWLSNLEKYDDFLAKKKLLDEKYAADKKRLDVTTWEATAGIVGGQLGQIAGLMDQGNAQQFAAWKALAIGEATIAGALTFMKMMGSATYPMNMVLAGMSAAITAAQIAKIAGTQYQAREMGGPVDAGNPYIVGERGPELFTPGASGMITANNKLGGSVVVNNTYDFRNASPETEQRMRAEIQRSSEATKAAIYSSMNRGGAFAYASGRMK